MAESMAPVIIVNERHFKFALTLKSTIFQYGYRRVTFKICANFKFELALSEIYQYGYLRGTFKIYVI